MPKHGVPATLLSDNGPQFAASVVRCFCERVKVRKTYSSAYHSQGSSIVESCRRSSKKSLTALVSEEGEECNMFLFAIALAYNTTPHAAAGYTLFLTTWQRSCFTCAKIFR